MSNVTIIPTPLAKSAACLETARDHARNVARQIIPTAMFDGLPPQDAMAKVDQSLERLRSYLLSNGANSDDVARIIPLMKLEAVIEARNIAALMTEDGGTA
ncbi:hypothetical protein LXM94_01905 [Rhizobium sp. TRM95111]|uniref:hypothetical protein n=1 Tax=Rhizobium alarense TaxID=2846851 RepID=UPI001F2196C3|nr:hypothetical protein [Rhizobium alarense]MCF3638725.1 hypothetical protein [Rhizobium alarense]